MAETTVKKIESSRLGEYYYDIYHKSGLRAFVFPKSFSTCFGVLGVRFGAIDRSFKNESGEIVELPAGTAHFLEHKLFENEDGTNSDEAFAKLGADDNAYTTYGSTRYIFSTTDNEYESIFELLRMVTNPYFTPKTVKKEQGIIKREIVMGDDSPWTCGSENMLRGLYKNSHLRDTICGTVDSVMRITDQTLHTAYKSFYTLSNMALSVCGNVEPEKVIDILDRVLSDVKSTKAAQSLMPIEPDEISTRYVDKRMKVSRPIFFFGIKDNVDRLSKEERAKRRCGMSILCNMLFSSSGEFYNRLLSNKLISPSLSFGYSMTRGTAYTVISGESEFPAKVALLVREKLAQTKKGGLSKEDFERCRRVCAAGYIRLFDSSEEIADDVIMNAWFTDTEPFSTLDILDTLTVEYCEKLLCDLLSGKSTLSVINPL